MTHQHLKLSVIMTVYNGEAFLQETLDAVFAQTFSDFEMVVVNNGCTDGTQKMLDAVNDDRLRVIQNQNPGSFGDGIRLAYQNARGQYIAIQDADDIPFVDRFQRQVQALDADEELGLVSSGFENIDQDGKHISKIQPPVNLQALIDSIQTSNPLAHSTYMYRKIASDAVGGYPIEYAYGPDFGLVVRLIKAGWKVQVLGHILLKLRQHAGQASLAPTLSVTRAHDAFFLYCEASELEGISADARLSGAKNISKKSLIYAVALMNERQVWASITQFYRGFSKKPLYSLGYAFYIFFRKLGYMIRSLYD